MSAIGSLVFCTDCGNLLDNSIGDAKAMLTCDCCGALNKDTSKKTVVTQSKPSAFPSLLRSKRSAVQTVEAADRTADAVAQEVCDNCGNPEMRYYAVQLRGADEGSTIFYECAKCGAKKTENN